MLEQKNKIGAKNKLKKDIKDKIEKWLVEYEKENPFQFSKDELITLINGLREEV